jgi:NhaP-type Na+/H+ and K+/H+ antiporter
MNGTCARTPGARNENDRRLFAGFTFNGHQSIDALASFYGLPVNGMDSRLTLSEFLAARMQRAPRAGATMRLGRTELVILETQGECISKVGLRLKPWGLVQERRVYVSRRNNERPSRKSFSFPAGPMAQPVTHPA